MIIKIDGSEINPEELNRIEMAVRKRERESPSVEVLVTSECNEEVFLPFKNVPTSLRCMTNYSEKAEFNLLNWFGYGIIVRQGIIPIRALQDELSKKNKEGLP